VRQVDLETALEQQERLTEIVDARQLVVKTGALAETIDEWSAAELRRAQSSHVATILATESGLSLSRATPMPPS
jgi:3-deoxy-D-arabino-heptulosonate 7-phosphate (DAHP) synthase class II